MDCSKILLQLWNLVLGAANPAEAVCRMEYFVSNAFELQASFKAALEEALSSLKGLVESAHILREERLALKEELDVVIATFPKVEVELFDRNLVNSRKPLPVNCDSPIFQFLGVTIVDGIRCALLCAICVCVHKN